MPNAKLPYICSCYVQITRQVMTIIFLTQKFQLQTLKATAQNFQLQTLLTFNFTFFNDFDFDFFL